jgi:formylglycine-generating enzyme required for sulfatase activity
MTRNLPPDLLSRFRRMLSPFVATVADRDALLTEAFYLRNPLLYGIEREGSPKDFVIRCIKKLLDYGCLSDGEHSLACLLLTVKPDCGVDKHAEIDELIELANGLCCGGVREPKDAVPFAPVGGPAQLQTIATPWDERMPTVFVSYSRNDADFADRLIADLRAAGHPCWIDESAIKGWDEWVLKTTIAEGINNSYALAPIITSKSLGDKWVQREILWAQRKEKPIIPVLLEDVTNESGFFPLVNCQGVSLFGGDYEDMLSRLLSSLPAPTLPDAGVGEAQEEDAAQEIPCEVISISRLRGAPRTLELAYLDRLRLEELLDTEKYTPMGGTSQRIYHRAEMRAVFELLPMGKDRKAMLEPRRFENAVEEIRNIRRAALLGEPGGGKTTTIWKLAADLDATALKDREAPIPLLIRLGKWTDANQPLHDFIASELGTLGAYLDALLDEKRAALLLDGLNEMPANQRQDKYSQVKSFIERHPALLAVVSCRELDYTIDLGFDRINITPLDPIRIREFAKRYLGAEQGEALFWKLAGQAAQEGHEKFMRKLSGQLSEPERVFWLESQLPEGISWEGWGDDKSNWEMWLKSNWEKWLKLREEPSSVMVLARNPYMLLMLTSVYHEHGELPENRGELFRLFVETLLKRERIPDEEQATLSAGLAKVAYEMQIRRVCDDSGNAMTAISKENANVILGERLLYLAGSANILAIGEQARFTHQLLQEYFAASHMDIEIRAGRLEAAAIWPPHRWWERSNWEEAAVLLAGLYSDDCSPIVEWVARANPEVAAMCVTRGGARLADASSERLRVQWIPRLTDLKGEPDPKARAAVGRALGLTGWDNRKGVGTVEMPLGDGRTVTLPDIDWVEIPDGEFQYGDNIERAARPQKLTIPAFHISRYPVTYAQFQTFLDDPEGYANSRWFEGLPTGDVNRRMKEQDFKFANHPREMVNLYQAVAFCRWFSWRLGRAYDLWNVAKWAVRLPTDYEWEKAARGSDGRIYPYEGEYDAKKGNTHDTGVGQTSAVGIFPNGASPYGVMDMSGNVMEWCLSNYDNLAIEALVDIEALIDNDQGYYIRALCGCAWFHNHIDARVARRYFLTSEDLGHNIGFRLACVARPQTSPWPSA